MIKQFPKSRICVLDIYPSLEKGIKYSLNFAKEHNILLNSSDGRRIIFFYCIKSIEEFVKNTPTLYPKVLCVSKNVPSTKIDSFIENYFVNVLNKIPLPYCGRHDLKSPDLEFAAQASLNQTKSVREYREFAAKLQIKTDMFRYPTLL